MILLDLFRAVRLLLADPKAWRQGKYAGKRIGETGGPNGDWSVIAETVLEDPEANCFCIAGAIDRVADNAGEGLTLRNAARREMMKTVTRTTVDWNDAPGRTHAEVIAALDATIARLEAA